MKIRTPFYSEIARKVAISQVAIIPLKKNLGGSRTTRVSYVTMIKRSEISRDWGVTVTRVPVALQKAQSVEEKKQFFNSWK